jgi:2-oxoglutarate ferredoxin oxidoreductase subunit beta
MSQLGKKDFVSDQDVRWCPGCGDYAILAQVQKVLPELGIPRENFVFVSGIGCSSRFPYYVNTYGFHSIHGRAPAIATGIKMSRPELSVWVVTGDGDALSIGGNHLIHLLRRNLDVNLLLFNNRIYGLTKGQYSPTSEVGKKTKSTPQGSVDHPFDPVALALGAGASFVARSVDVDARHLQGILRRAHEHRGTFVLEHGRPLVFGAARDRGIRLGRDLRPEVVQLGDGIGEGDLLVHDETNPAIAQVVATLAAPAFPTPIGVFTAVERPCYEDGARALVDEARRRSAPDLSDLLTRGDTWTVS